MKTIKTIRELIADKSDQEMVFMSFFEKNEADEWLEENEQEPLNENEWLDVLKYMETDDGLWQNIIESWNWSIEKVTSKRKEG